MRRYTCFGIFASLWIMACDSSSNDPFGPVAVTAIAGAFVAPESCAQLGSGWVVSDRGCAPSQPCWEKSESRGKIIAIAEDGTRTVLLDNLQTVNGVAVDGDGNVWTVDKGTRELIVLRADGAVIRFSVPNAGLLNDVSPAPWHSGAVIVSDSITGNIIVAGLDGDSIVASKYLHVDGAPNGVAEEHGGTGVVIAGLGDLNVPGKAGSISSTDPAGEEDCAMWKGVQGDGIAAPPGKKLDGIVPWKRGDVEGYLVSAIVDTGKPADNPLDATLWFVAPGRAPEQLLDLSTFSVDGAKPISAADIGYNPDTRTICVPDLNGSIALSEAGAGAARVYLVTGL